MDEDMVCYFVSDILNDNSLLPEDRAGVYRIYAPSESLEKLLGSRYLTGYMSGANYSYNVLYDHLNEYATAVSDDTTYYSFYVGRSTAQSLRTRILQHLNNNSDDNLRTTIGSLLSNDRDDDNAINGFLENGVVGFMEMADSPVEEGGDEEQQIFDMESEMINGSPSPLNIDDNGNEVVLDFVLDLQTLRGETKED